MDDIQELIDQMIEGPLAFAALTGVWGDARTTLRVIHEAMQRGFVDVRRNGETVPMWKLEQIARSRDFDLCRPWMVVCTDKGAEGWAG